MQKVIILSFSVLFAFAAELPAQLRFSAVTADAIEYSAKLGLNAEVEKGKKDGNANPDTLIVTFTGVPLIDTCTVWDSLLLFIPADSQNGKAYPVILSQKPEPMTEDSLIWGFILSLDENVLKPREGDKVFLNPVGQQPCGLPLNQGRNIVRSFIFSEVEGVNINSAESMSLFGKIEGRRVVIPVDTIPVIKDDEIIGYKYERRWMPPVFFQDNGTIDEHAQKSCKGQEGGMEIVVYPENCLSAVVVYSRSSYTAHVSIYDHLGKFVHSSVQRFGRCGELNNTLRNRQAGWLSYLVWNQRDTKGQYVGNGVYIWKVAFKVPGKPPELALYKQGIARSMPPKEGCAVNGWK